MISLYCWNKAQKAGLLLNPELLRTHLAQFRASQDVYWIDLEKPTADEEKLIFEQFFPVHRLTLIDITQPYHERAAQGHLPKAEEFPDYLFVVVNPLRPDWLQLADNLSLSSGVNEQSVSQLSTVLTPTLLITHHREPMESIHNLHAFLSKHEEQADRGPDYLFHLILDGMVDEYAPVLDRIQDVLDKIEEDIFTNPTRGMLQQLLHLKRRIFTLRKTLVYEREILARLQRGDFALIDTREIAYYRNVYDHVARFTELTETSREMVNDLMQTHLSAASHKLNEIMKVLTMISTVVLPMTLVAGIYGMNFEEMPEIKWYFGYPMALALMLLTGLGSLAFFRWRKWL